MVLNVGSALEQSPPQPFGQLPLKGGADCSGLADLCGVQWDRRIVDQRVSLSPPSPPGRGTGGGALSPPSLPRPLRHRPVLQITPSALRTAPPQRGSKFFDLQPVLRDSKALGWQVRGYFRVPPPARGSGGRGQDATLIVSVPCADALPERLPLSPSDSSPYKEEQILVEQQLMPISVRLPDCWQSCFFVSLQGDHTVPLLDTRRDVRFAVLRRVPSTPRYSSPSSRAIRASCNSARLFTSPVRRAISIPCW